MNDTIVTPAGLEKLERDLAELVDVRRPDIARRIKEARELGDLKENAEYHAAKNEQGFLESKIRQLQDRVRTARVIENVDASLVGVGTRVAVIDADTGECEHYVVTGVAESEPLENRISNESPIGSALLGARVGDTVTVKLPAGQLQLRVEQIEAA